MITNIKDFRSINENNDSITFWDIVDMDKFQKLVENIYNMCGGEYGYTYYHKESKRIAIVLGDSNPFSIEGLESWIKNTVIKDYKILDLLDIEVDMEWVPNEGDDGWLYWNGKKWITA